MRFKNLSVAAAALAMTATPALAAPANPASSLSVAKSVRASSPSGKSNKLAGSAIIPAVLALGIVAGGVIIAVSDDNKSKSR
ncbi:hypothetical protein FPZ24_06475 [Sphingomonas panacisoli]|uniref:Uncharacterized protein n=1 Tax=Sphingomonas panacisoli TaxID=1813879 RepID=A0A5B8LFY9_9SPHN|nr:hypothetical protein [Sphingomonas panacisoli]QDZ07168.1 hypothetical protein FPZ24_06475 [Sphingomonas panacisoli]